ncbi:trypsin-like serine protease [Streptomyces sp. H27-G5]|uniref:trypsin-like serine protease n=1 Tax=Streptomyces sp. H27-G5 TaxID=2996698 RepID=UPI00226D6238|nr:trypsin-like serine protease [Streptomyces sp. H27-G5]MCY0920982.1 trypsin-like serine protease [Streptomyces sp. H27-G5]
MRRTLTMAAAATALALLGGPLPVAEAGTARAVGRWSVREAQSFWTAERMASATPAPLAPGAAPDTAVPSGAPTPDAVPDRVPVPDNAPSPDNAATAVPDPSAAGTPVTAPAGSATPVPEPSAESDRAGDTIGAALAGPGTGANFDGIPVVGRMFVMKGAGAYFCTASVVASPGRNLVLSAAHCLLGSDTRKVAFVPRYTAKNPRPHGMFPVLRDAKGRSKVWIHPRYRSQGANRAATLDVAFAQVGPGPKGRRVQDVVGGNRLLTGGPYAHPRVTLIGHPSAAARPRVCVNRTTKFTSKDARIPGSFLRIVCTGYPGGTSGGPFLARYDAKTRTGDVIGVIGGWKTGGDTPDVSYSSYFGKEIRALFDTAVAGARVG